MIHMQKEKATEEFLSWTRQEEKSSIWQRLRSIVSWLKLEKRLHVCSGLDGQQICRFMELSRREEETLYGTGPIIPEERFLWPSPLRYWRGQQAFKDGGFWDGIMPPKTEGFGMTPYCVVRCKLIPLGGIQWIYGKRCHPVQRVQLHFAIRARLGSEAVQETCSLHDEWNGTVQNQQEKQGIVTALKTPWDRMSITAIISNLWSLEQR